MLRLSRYSNTGFFIGEDIYIKVSKVHKDGRVDLDIHAPKEKKILREELVHRNRQQNTADEGKEARNNEQ